MATSAIPFQDFRLVLHDSLSDGYELSQVLLAKAGCDGKLQLLTSGWERALGYSRAELNRATLGQLMWSDPRTAAAAVAAILDHVVMASVDVRLRCRDGAAKGLRLHRRYDRRERMVYIVAEETAAQTAAILPYRAERRAARR
jgi:PAS domain-containing protein